MDRRCNLFTKRALPHFLCMSCNQNWITTQLSIYLETNITRRFTDENTERERDRQTDRRRRWRERGRGKNVGKATPHHTSLYTPGGGGSETKREGEGNASKIEWKIFRVNELKYFYNTSYFSLELVVHLSRWFTHCNPPVMLIVLLV